MKRDRIIIESEIQFRSVDYQDQIKITVDSQDVADLCCAFVLLGEGMIDSLVVRCSSKNSGAGKYLEFAYSKQPLAGAQKPNGTLIALDKITHEYILHTLLRLYRDKVTPVDHVDVELTLNGRETYLTFQFDAFEPSVTLEQAKRRLGLEE